MKWIKVIAMMLCAGVAMAVVAGVVGVRMYRGTPQWYRAHVLTDEQRRAVANSADQKFADLFSWAAAVQAQGVRRMHGTSRNETPLGSKTITLSDDELEAFFEKWQQPGKAVWEQRLLENFSDPRIVLMKDEIILAGQSKQVDAVMSMALQPSIDQQEQLHLTVGRVEAGNLPLPSGMVSSRLSEFKDVLAWQLMQYQRGAAIDRTFSANRAAMGSAMMEIMLAALDHRASDSTIFVPYDLGDMNHSLPVRLAAISVDDGSVTLTLAPLSGDQKTQLLNRLRQPYPQQAAMAQ